MCIFEKGDSFISGYYSTFCIVKGLDEYWTYHLKVTARTSAGWGVATFSTVPFRTGEDSKQMNKIYVSLQEKTCLNVLARFVSKHLAQIQRRTTVVYVCLQQSV